MPIKTILRVILLRVIRFLISITIESWIFKKSFNLSPKLSVQYTMTLNLLASACEWIIFLNAELIFPAEARNELISYLLFQKVETTSFIVFLLTAFNFALLLLIKWIGLETLEFLSSGDMYKISHFFSENPEKKIKISEQYKEFRVVLVAHTLSYSLFLVLVFTLFIFK
ncbi:MAG: filament integrity protein FraC [Planktothrix sp.]